ncbi:MAG: element excision factor XisH family protein [Saprospiraceae bacterium]|nr:element excision factor XisH family protein [Saprospiraceae bacterium]MDZ4705366.1 element excision factor XisH family protein [Saprospiraceae bacterium]
MARDKFHEIVRIVLEKDGYTITHDPYPLQLTRRKLGIDLGAEKLIAAIRESEKIAVEIKSFRHDSFMYDMPEALGQYLVYQPFLHRKEAGRILFLAVPQPVYYEYFVDEDIEFLCEQSHLKIVVFDPQTEQIVLWKR